MGDLHRLPDIGLQSLSIKRSIKVHGLGNLLRLAASFDTVRCPMHARGDQSRGHNRKREGGTRTHIEIHLPSWSSGKLGGMLVTNAPPFSANTLKYSLLI